MADRDNHIFVSPVSAYEIAYKHQLGKLRQVERFVESFAEQLVAAGFDNLPITHEHALTAGRLGTDHRDPFDRLLIGQALVEEATLVSNEQLFDRYGVRRLW